MQIFRLSTVLPFIAISIALGSLSAQSATEIISKSIALLEGTSNSATMRMEIIRPSWTRDLTIKSWSMGKDYALILITDPARDKGTVFLKRQNELWNWQPRIERSIKMPPSMMLQSWMGSDFTNDDLVRQSSIEEDYTHTLLQEETVNGIPCYVIELIPRQGAPVVWGKVISWISKNGYMTIKNAFYDEDGVLVNTMIGSEIKRMDDRTLPTKLEVIPANEDGNKTVITYQSLNFNIPIDASFFSVQNMRQVK